MTKKQREQLIRIAGKLEGIAEVMDLSPGEADVLLSIVEQLDVMLQEDKDHKTDYMPIEGGELSQLQFLHGLYRVMKDDNSLQKRLGRIGVW